MPQISANDVELYYEVQGSGPPLMLVHGSWDNAGVWEQTADRLAGGFRVIAYDRRGHTRSERPPGPRTRRQDEDDLAALISAVAGEPAYVAANSFGGVISMGLVARRPQLIRALAIHEPPAVGAADGGDLAEQAQAAVAKLGAVLAEIEAGDEERATQRFVDEVAIGPGAWAVTPDEVRAALVENAPAFLAENRDDRALQLDFATVRRCGRPMLVTKGDDSPPWLLQLAGRVAELLAADTATIAGAGHVPHETHPGPYAEVLREFFGVRAALAA